MKVGVTGHQNRPGIEWPWVRQNIKIELEKLPSPILGFSSLAEGADQIFAETVLQCGGRIIAVVPCPDYERHFAAEALAKYVVLKKTATVKDLVPEGSDEESFYNAGKYIVDNVERIFAVWDGLPARGVGGTADVVEYALAKCVPVTQINPIAREVSARGR